jgi:hypothetical protein
MEICIVINTLCIPKRRHPRSLNEILTYVLWGRIGLVMSRLKEIIMNWVAKMAHSYCDVLRLRWMS